MLLSDGSAGNYYNCLSKQWGCKNAKNKIVRDFGVLYIHILVSLVHKYQKGVF